MEPVDVVSALFLHEHADGVRLLASVAQGQTLTWSTAGQEYYDLLDGLDDPPERVQFRAYVQGIGREDDVLWLSSPILVESRHRPPWS